MQAVNGVGVVSLDDNVGSYYRPGRIAPALEPKRDQTTVRLGALPVEGNSASPVSVSATVTGPGGAPVVGEPVTFTIGGATAVDDRTDAGGLARATITPTDLPGSRYELTATFDGTQALAGASDSRSFTIDKRPTTLTPSLDPTVGADSGIGVTLRSNGAGLVGYPIAFVLTPATGGVAVVQDRTTDLDGRASLGTVTQLLAARLPAGSYSVRAYFGFVHPVEAPESRDLDPVYSSSSTAAPVPLTLAYRAPAITSVNSATFVVGTAGSFTVSTTGLPANAITNASFAGCTKSPLPATLTFVDNTDDTATLAGTPASARTYTLCLNAANGAGPTATQTLTLTVKAPTRSLGPGTTSCDGTFGGRGSDVVVPAGAVCTLVPGTQLTGGVEVQKGGSLDAQGVSIGRDVTVTDAAWIRLGGGGSIGGDLKVRRLGGSPPGGHDALCNTTVVGDARIQDGLSGAALDIGSVGACSGGPGLTIGGDLRVTTTAGNVTVGGNTIKGDLLIANNTGRLTVSGNAARDIQVHDNTVGVGSTLTTNAAAGDCKLDSNKPKITGTGNTVARGRQNTCNRVA